MKAHRFLFCIPLILLSCWSVSLAEEDKPQILPAITFLLTNLAPPLSPCAGQIPAEQEANGDYRAYVIPIATEYSNPKVAMAQNGWRALVLSDKGLDVFDRDSNVPRAYIGVNQPYTASISLNHDGSAFAVGDADLLGSSRLRFFECGEASPAWSWVSSVGSWPKVAVGSLGKWVAITTNGPEYFALFRRDLHVDGVGKPVFETKFGWQYPIKKMVLSGKEPIAAVITGSNFDDNYTLHLIGRNGLKWSSTLTGSRWNVPDRVVMDISTDGNYIAVGGFGGLIRFYSTLSATPLWTVSLESNGLQDAYFTDLDLSQDGGSLAFVVRKYNYDTPDIPRDHLYFIRNTSTQPNFGSSGNWNWFAGKSFQWSEPSPYPYSTPPPHIILDPINRNTFNLENVAISEDGQYIFVSGNFHYMDGNTLTFIEDRTAGISFHRDHAKPLRIYLSGVTGVADMEGAISPDGSWVIMAGEKNVARFEVAPVEMVSCNQPIQVDFPLIGGLFGLDNVTVNYTIYKPGRASRIQQNWELHAMPFDVLLGNYFTCSGDFSFQYPPLSLPAGSVTFKSSRELELPSCPVGDAVGIEGYDLISALKNGSGQVSYSTDWTTLVRFTIP